MSSTRRSSRIGTTRLLDNILQRDSDSVRAASKQAAPIVVEESQGHIAEDDRQSSPIFEPEDEDDDFGES